MSTVSSMPTKPVVPPGYHTVQPYLIARPALEAIAFYKTAFGAVERLCMKDAAGVVGHAELILGDSCVMLADGNPELGAFPPEHFGGSPVSLLMYVEDCDAVYRQAIAAGSTIVREPADQPYGDRVAGVKDPYGYTWYLATHLENKSKEQLEDLMKDWTDHAHSEATAAQGALSPERAARVDPGSLPDA